MRIKKSESSTTNEELEWRLQASNLRLNVLLKKLDDPSTWDDLMYKIYVRQAIEAGLKDSEAGRTISVKDVRAKFGLMN